MPSSIGFKINTKLIVFFFLNNIRHGNFNPFEESSESNFEKCNNIESSDKVRLLMYSYEDDERKVIKGRNFLESVLDNDFELHKEEYFGSSNKFFDILVLRDAFNFFASRLKRLEKIAGIKDIREIANNWKTLAEEAVKRGEKKEAGKLFINYNEWFTSKKYREGLSSLLEGEFNDASLDEVTNFGGGSSFDRAAAYPKLTLKELRRDWVNLLKPKRLLFYFKRMKSPKGREMKVLDRWKLFRDDQVFKDIFRDKEIVELSNRLFGEIPGTMKFVNKL